jgi:hypothetical protein
MRLCITNITVHIKSGIASCEFSWKCIVQRRQFVSTRLRKRPSHSSLGANNLPHGPPLVCRLPKHCGARNAASVNWQSWSSHAGIKVAFPRRVPIDAGSFADPKAEDLTYGKRSEGGCPTDFGTRP